jgi:hypothetical protein
MVDCVSAYDRNASSARIAHVDSRGERGSRMQLASVFETRPYEIDDKQRRVFTEAHAFS